MERECFRFEIVSRLEGKLVLCTWVIFWSNFLSPQHYPKGERGPGRTRDGREITVARACWLQGFGLEDDDTAWCVCGKGNKVHVSSSEDSHSLLPRARVMGTARGGSWLPAPSTPRGAAPFTRKLQLSFPSLCLTLLSVSNQEWPLGG